MIPADQWNELTKWWTDTATRLGVGSSCVSFFMPGSGALEALAQVLEARGDLHYVLFVLIRYWVPPILPPAGKERTAKNDPDYWIESEQIIKQAVARLRELRPFLTMLTDSAPKPSAAPAASELDLS